MCSWERHFTHSETFWFNNVCFVGSLTHRTRSPADCLVVAASLVTKCRVVHTALLKLEQK